MPGVDRISGSRERDKLTIAEVCADLGINCGRSANGGRRGAARVHHAANGSFRVRRSEHQRWLPVRWLAKL